MATAVASRTNPDTHMCGVCRKEIEDGGLVTEKHVYHEDCFVYVLIMLKIYI